MYSFTSTFLFISFLWFSLLISLHSSHISSSSFIPSHSSPLHIYTWAARRCTTCVFPLTRSLASHLLTASHSRTLAIATPDSLKCISLQHWRISFKIYIEFRHHSFGIILSLDIVGLIYSLSMLGRIYPSTRITNNRLDCVIEHRTLPTTTTHYYYPLLLPTTHGHRTLQYLPTFLWVFHVRPQRHSFYQHWVSLVFTTIGHHWYLSSLALSTSDTIVISIMEHHWITGPRWLTWVINHWTSARNIIIGHHYHHETLDVI